MPQSGVPPVRRRCGGRLADRPVGLTTLALIGFSAAVVVLLCVVAVGRIGALDDNRRDLYENAVVALSDLDAIQTAYEEVREEYTSYLLADPAIGAASVDQLAADRAGLQERIEAYAGTTEHPDRFSTLADDVAAYFAISDGQLVPALDAGDMATAGAVAVGPLVDVQQAVIKDFTGLRAVLREQADAQVRAGAEDASSAKSLLWGMFGLSVAISLVLALLVVRRILGRAGAAEEPVDALTAGGPTVHPRRTSTDEIDRLPGVSALAQEDLRDVLQSVVTSVDAMAAFSHRLSAEFGDRLITSIEVGGTGGSGKGFAVVANEVEELARATATTGDLRAGAGRSTR